MSYAAGFIEAKTPACSGLIRSTRRSLDTAGGLAVEPTTFAKSERWTTPAEHQLGEPGARGRRCDRDRPCGQRASVVDLGDTVDVSAGRGGGRSELLHAVEEPVVVHGDDRDRHGSDLDDLGSGRVPGNGGRRVDAVAPARRLAALESHDKGVIDLREGESVLARNEGDERIRTAVRGFAGLCLTTRPRRRTSAHPSQHRRSDNPNVTPTREEALLAHAIELEERDLRIAALLDEIDALARRAAAVRERAGEVGDRLDALPDDRRAAAQALDAARAAEALARAELGIAEDRVAALGRRASREERDQADRELTRAREDVHDAEQRSARAAHGIDELDELDHALRAEADGLVVAATDVASGIAALPRVSDAGKSVPGPSLVSVEEWGARARAALFVARGALATERERIVIEANTLGSSVLGEPLGGSSAALVRRRLQQHLASTNASG